MQSRQAGNHARAFGVSSLRLPWVWAFDKNGRACTFIPVKAICRRPLNHLWCRRRRPLHRIRCKWAKAAACLRETQLTRGKKRASCPKNGIKNGGHHIYLLQQMIHQQFLALIYTRAGLVNIVWRLFGEIRCIWTLVLPICTPAG